MKYEPDREGATSPRIRVGCAGWSISATSSRMFPSEGSHLERYASVFNAIEINSSFYRPHQTKTYRKWAESVPESFRFCVKIPKTISHQKRLIDCDGELEAFFGQAEHLGNKLGCLLLQLPPSLKFDAARVGAFLDCFARHNRVAHLVWEPRHLSWFSPAAHDVMRKLGVNRVGADPALCAEASIPTGRVEYLRLHGSPRMYYDSYSSTELERIADSLCRPDELSADRWCIFDNTAHGHAIPNALTLMRLTARHT